MAIQENMQSYIEKRIDQYYKWYSANAKKSKNRFQLGKVISASSAVLIPVITNLTLEINWYSKNIDVGDILVTILGLAVALLVAFEGVFHYKEQWVNYRTTAEYIKTQRILFLHMSEDYEDLDEKKSIQTIG